MINKPKLTLKELIGRENSSEVATRSRIGTTLPNTMRLTTGLLFQPSSSPMPGPDEHLSVNSAMQMDQTGPWNALDSQRALQTSKSSLSLFQNTAQIDVVTLLLLLGENAIWKVVWSRFQSRRSHLTHWLFAVSPGWTPLAGSLLAALGGALHAPNLIFERPPEGVIDSSLILTNLNSGATPAGTNTIIQNIWSTWQRGSLKEYHKSNKGKGLGDPTRQIGIIDVRLDTLQIENWNMILLQSICLLIQLGGSFLIGILKRNYEPFIVFAVAFAGQSLLIFSITPRPSLWNKAFRGHKSHPSMLYSSSTSQGFLFIRSARLRGQAVSLEEYTWPMQTMRTRVDTIKMFAAGLAFITLILQVLLLGWTQPQSRVFYAIFGALGLCANTIEATSQPRWSSASHSAFSGKAFCAPRSCSTMGAVGVLIAGNFPAAQQAARRLYPDNERLAQSLRALEHLFGRLLCPTCRSRIASSGEASTPVCSRQQGSGSREVKNCASLLADAVKQEADKQLRDGLATVSHYLSSAGGNSSLTMINTTTRHPNQQPYRWEVVP